LLLNYIIARKIVNISSYYQYGFWKINKKWNQWLRGWWI